ncbi:MAG: hypothetical protein ACI4HM_07340 [Ruminococcus sp.]
MKEYVSVTAKFDQDGSLLPLIINWDDGRKFEIDKITDIRFASSLKSGGAGVRYTCQILNQIRYLYLEDNRWFIEK